MENIMPLPKRYIWIVAGAAAGLGLMALRKKLAGEDTSAPEMYAEKPTRTKDGAAPIDVDVVSPKTDAKESEQSDGAKELAAFLAGEQWFDELGWQGLWEREGIDTPSDWLKNQGIETLKAERAKLVEHPALLAGCRRRWIVVCRYAGIDVGDASAIWSETD